MQAYSERVHNRSDIRRELLSLVLLHTTIFISYDNISDIQKMKIAPCELSEKNLQTSPISEHLRVAY